MKTQCGVEMAQIERGWARQGFRVISWTVLNREMNTVMSNGRPRSPIEIAANLGAEALFQINSLEKSRKNTGGTVKWERVVYNADATGGPLSKQPVTTKTWDYLNRIFFATLETDYLANRRAVTLDASTVLVKTGESIWYYKWSHAEPYDEKNAPSALLECRDGGTADQNKSEKELTRCRNARAKRPAKPKQPATAEQAGQQNIPETPNDPDSALYVPLLEDVINDLVKSFSGKAASR